MSKHHDAMSRRDFLSLSAAASAGLAFSGWAGSSLAANYAQRKVSVFSKHLQWLDYGPMAELAAEIGFDGVDLTVRPRGHVLPERVEQDLPRAVKAVRNAGLNVDMITTRITDPDDPLTEKVLSTASRFGIANYRMGYIDYDDKAGVAGTLEDLKPRMAALARLNEKYSIHGAYQNHAGTRIGGAIWDIWELVKDLDPQWIGCQFDIRHAVAEGGTSWPVRLKLLLPHVRSMVIKDFYWGQEEGKWRIVNCPVGEGMVDFPAYFEILNQARFDGPFSMHFEYDMPVEDMGLTRRKQATVSLMKKDLGVLRSYLALG
jgi:sugar phosphate isomerase/epimerase